MLSAELPKIPLQASTLPYLATDSLSSQDDTAIEVMNERPGLRCLSATWPDVTPHPMWDSWRRTLQSVYKRVFVFANWEKGRAHSTRQCFSSLKKGVFCERESVEKDASAEPISKAPTKYSEIMSKNSFWKPNRTIISCEIWMIELVHTHFGSVMFSSFEDLFCFCSTVLFRRSYVNLQDYNLHFFMTIYGYNSQFPLNSRER